jgi:hypothetical protein
MIKRFFIMNLPIAVVFLSASAHATTKGLSQIVTPDLQKPAELSLSYQQQSDLIGNPQQLQAELGLTPWLEVAAFKGFSPNEYIFGAEVGLIQHEPYLLSAGIVNYSTIDGKPQPFLQAGYYLEHSKWIVGGISANSEAELLLGWAYDFDSHWRTQVDYQSGERNFLTFGFTYTLNERFQFNPALYISNGNEHGLAGYIVATYTLPLWPTKKNPKAPTSL